MQLKYNIIQSNTSLFKAWKLKTGNQSHPLKRKAPEVSYENAITLGPEEGVSWKPTDDRKPYSNLVENCFLSPDISR